MDDLPLFLGWGEAERLTGRDRDTLKKLSASGDFPTPVQLTPHRESLVTEEVIAWYQDRLINHRVSYEEQACA